MSDDYIWDRWDGQGWFSFMEREFPDGYHNSPKKPWDLKHPRAPIYGF